MQLFQYEINDFNGVAFIQTTKYTYNETLSLKYNGYPVTVDFVWLDEELGDLVYEGPSQGWGIKEVNQVYFFSEDPRCSTKSKQVLQLILDAKHGEPDRLLQPAEIIPLKASIALITISSDTI